MGCDGGTIPRRNELVRTKKKKEAKDKDAEIAAKWKYCAISSKELVRPIVSCDLGRLYNKDAVIEYLLNKEAPNLSLVAHIRSLKDITTLNLTPRQKDEKTNKPKESSSQHYDFVCPVVGLEMNGKYKFFYFRTCGCVVSERAIKEVKSQFCLVCNKPFSEDDLIVINGNDDEVELLKNKMNERRSKSKEEKKKKRKNEETNNSNGDKTKIFKSNATSTSNSEDTVINVKTSSLSVLPEKASKSYSVKNDPNATETYKSLFTTHESAKNRPKAHWVTFNPCYN